jgi:VWFA-related protein
MRYWCVIGAVLFFSAVPAAGQQIPSLGETIEVSIVNLDVVVTDKQGNRIRGLKASDFEVREEGKPQAITNFAEYESSGAASGAPVFSPTPPVDRGTTAVTEPTPRPDQRQIVIFVERARLLPFDAERLFASMKDTVRKVVRPGDAVAIALWDGSLTMKQDFTDDVAALERALDELREINSKATLFDAQSIETRMEEQDRIDRMLEGADVPADTSMQMESRFLSMRAMMQLRSKVYAIRSMINLLAPARGRKILLMATRRFSEYAGAEFYPGGRIPPMDRDEFDTAPLRKSVEDAANAAGVTVYAMYTVGLVSSNSASAEFAPDLSRSSAERDADRGAFDFNVLLNESVPLEQLARATGGLSAWGAGNIAALMPKIASDMESYYSLAYRAAPGKKKQRNVTVRTVNGNYLVRSRTGYVEKNDADRMADRVVAHLFRGNETNLLNISAQLGEKKKNKRTVSVPVKVRIPIGKLTMVPQGRQHSGGFTVFAAAGGKLGVTGEVTQKTQPFQIPASEVARARASHYSYSLTVMTDGGAEAVAVGVLDEVSKQFGVVRIPLK